MTAVELLPPAAATPENETWYELRRTGVTASEIAVVLGISPYQSPFSLYWSKVCDWRWDGNVYADTGRHLEASIAEWWVSQQSRYNIEPAGLYGHGDRAWQIATPDRILYFSCHECVEALLECKWVAYSWDGWGEPGTEDVPVYYRAQCLWQLDVLGVDEVHVAALGPGGFRAYVVRRDEDDLAVMRAAGAEFVRRLDERDPPPLDSHIATLTTLKRLHPDVGEGDIEVPQSLKIRYRYERQRRQEAEDSIALCEAEIRAALGSTYARATHDGKLVASRSVFSQARIDVAALRRDLPDIAEKYTTTTTVDRLNPGRTTSHD